MSKLGFSRMRSVYHLRSFSGSTKSFQSPTPSSSDSIMKFSFSNLKLTAEKLVKDLAQVKTDLDMETIGRNLELKRSVDHTHDLEEKVQCAINENAKLQVKQKDYWKLLKGLESKFSSTKALCDHLKEILPQLASLVRDTEQDKKLFEDSANGDAFDSSQLQFRSPVMKLKSAEENLRTSEEQIAEQRTEKEEKEKAYVNEHNKISKLIEEKDSLVKGLEEDIAVERLLLVNLTFALDKLQHESQTNDEICQHLRVTLDNLEKEKHALQSSNSDYARSLLESRKEIHVLEDSLRSLQEKSVELDKHSSSVSNHVSQLNTAFDTCYKLAQQEKELTVKRAQGQFDQLHAQFLHVTTENAGFESEIEDLKRKIIELQKGQELLISQHAEECRLKEEKIESLEFDAKNLLFGKSALELHIGKLEEDIECMFQCYNVSEVKVQDLMVQISKLETENQGLQEEMQAKLQVKLKEAEVLEKETLKHQVGDSLEKQASQLRDSVEEKEQLHLQHKDREVLLEDQTKEIQTSLPVAENTNTEANKQYDMMLDSKQMKLSKHLKERSQRKDHVKSRVGGYAYAFRRSTSQFVQVFHEESMLKNYRSPPPDEGLPISRDEILLVHGHHQQVWQEYGGFPILFSVRPGESKATLLFLRTREIHEIENANLSGCQALGSTSNGWVLFLKCDKVTLFYFHVLRDSILDDVPPLPQHDMLGRGWQAELIGSPESADHRAYAIGFIHDSGYDEVLVLELKKGDLSWKRYTWSLEYTGPVSGPVCYVEDGNKWILIITGGTQFHLLNLTKLIQIERDIPNSVLHQSVGMVLSGRSLYIFQGSYNRDVSAPTLVEICLPSITHDHGRGQVIGNPEVSFQMFMVEDRRGWHKDFGTYHFFEEDFEGENEEVEGESHVEYEERDVEYEDSDAEYEGSTVEEEGDDVGESDIEDEGGDVEDVGNRQWRYGGSRSGRSSREMGCLLCPSIQVAFASLDSPRFCCRR